MLVTISLSIGDFSIRSIAGPDSTPCTAQASTRAAPLSFSAVAAFVIVPAVSMMSSWMMQVRPVDVADHVHHFRRAVVAAPLVDDRQLGVEPLRVGARAFGAAGVGRHDRQVRRTSSRDR